MKHAQRLLALVTLQLCVFGAHAATRVDLNQDWQFFKEQKPELVRAAPTRVPADAGRTNVPHTWNREGEATYDYLGAMWYVKRFDLPKLPADAIAQLNFGATFYRSRVFVN